MGVICINYDLLQPGQKYDNLIAAIQAMNLGGGKVLYSTWLVTDGGLDVVQIRDALRRVLDSNDKLFITKITTPAAWVNLGPDWEAWLKRNL